MAYASTIPRRIFLEESLITIEVTNARIEKRSRAATLSVVATVFLTALKLGTGFLTHSAGVFAEALHSGLDLVSAALAYFTIREAIKPADEDHPFGHGKFETVSSLFESFLLILAAVFIVKEGYDHIVNPEPLLHSEWAILVIFISMVASYFVYKHNSVAALETESSALSVNSLHFLSDVVASLGVLVGLILAYFTGFQIIDSLVAFGVAIYISISAFPQIRSSLNELVDQKLSDDDLKKVETVFLKFSEKVIRFSELKTRRSGSLRLFYFTIFVRGDLSVKVAHDICDDIEAALRREFAEVSVNIHVEPDEKAN